MACKNQKCKKCTCDKPKEIDGWKTLTIAGQTPEPAQLALTEETKQSRDWWKYVTGFILGWLFFGR